MDGGSAVTNSLGMVFVRFAPGSFTMGSENEPKLADTNGVSYDQQPAHTVTLSRELYILNGPVPAAAYRMSGLPGSAEDVSWINAAAFCEWLSRKEGKNYRLPTEAEWECCYQRSHGGTEMKSREWVQDWHGSYAPDTVTDPTGPASGMTKVVREGARRETAPPAATSSPWGLKPTSFRVAWVREPMGKPVTGPLPFCQSAVKQDASPAKLGPNPNLPYFHVRAALPIPPDNDLDLNGPLLGLDPAVLSHNHSPGFEALPNGDLLAVYFSSDERKSESDSGTRFVQARLRYGAEEWEPPELFFDFKPFNDQSGLLWADGSAIRFFGGGRGMSPWLPFKMAVSTNNGADWTLSLPLLEAPAKEFTAQPIVNAFRGDNGAIYFAMDGSKEESFLWRSRDEGIHWHDMGGRTGGRHSTILPLDGEGHLLSIGGKNSDVDGWSPQSTSSDWGANWSPGRRSPFPALGSNQRPCLIRLANGHLCFVSDSYNRKGAKSPGGWNYGPGCIVAISTNNGAAWRIKRLPVELPHEHDRKYGTLGYATVRQAPNGLIHLLSTKTQPCLHYEFNESWVFSDAGDIAPETSGGSIRTYTERYPGGAPRATWGARLCQGGRYVLNGTETTWYENGQKEHEVAYVNGRKRGVETFWAPDGTKVWSWTHRPEEDSSTWVHYWRNGRKRIESQWSTRARARDLDREFFGLVANGAAYHWNEDGSPAHAYGFTNGVYAGPLPLPAAQVAATSMKGAGP